MAKKIIIYLSLILGLFLLIHNVYYYPLTAGYDSFIHIRYADILTSQWRLPTLSETREAYNPPFFYLMSGLLGRFYSQLTGLDFFSTLKLWQYLNPIFAVLLIFFWYQVVKPILPKSKIFHYLFIGLIFSLPVFQKTIPMYNLELFSAFLISLGFWYFIVHYQSKPTLLKTILLASIMVINLLTRMSSFILLITLLIGFVSLIYLKQNNRVQIIKFLTIFSLLILLGTSWFYIGRRNQEIYGVGEGGEPNLPFFQRQPLAFYTEIPFKLMMGYPIRFAPNTPLNRLIPIYYSEFWGDWWNYFSQRRFGISIDTIRKDRNFTSPTRVADLAWQNRINLPYTLLILFSFITFFSQRKKDWFIPIMMIIMLCLTYLGWLVMITKYPSFKGDSIKASYMLHVLPILIYSLIIFLSKIMQKNKYIFSAILIYLILVTANNLTWSWF